MPTDRSMPAVSTTSVCAIATSASSTPLLAAVLTTLRRGVVSPGFDRRVVDEIDGEHHHEDAEGEQRAPLLGKPEAPVLHAFTAGRTPASPLVDVERARDQRALGDLRADELAPDRAVIEHEHAVAAADQLVVVGRIEEDRRARIGELAQELVHLLLGADVDAARRIVEEDDARAAHQPFGDDDLLLVAAGERADRHVGAAGA